MNFPIRRKCLEKSFIEMASDFTVGKKFCEIFFSPIKHNFLNPYSLEALLRSLVLMDPRVSQQHAGLQPTVF